MRYPYRLPLKFLGLWIVNLVVLLALGYGLGIHDYFFRVLHMSVKGLTYIYLTVGAILAALEEWIIDKLKGN